MECPFPRLPPIASVTSLAGNISLHVHLHCVYGLTYVCIHKKIYTCTCMLLCLENIMLYNYICAHIMSRVQGTEGHTTDALSGLDNMAALPASL